MSNTCVGTCTGGDMSDGSGTSSGTSDTSGESVSIFAIPNMDCPSEEGMIRMALNGLSGIKRLSFDLGNRRLEILHDGDVEPIAERLATLGLGASLQQSVASEARAGTAGNPAASAAQESGTLRLLLAINALMFVVEMTAGVIAQSTGLMSDSLDMFADAAVYGLALYAVGHSAKRQVRAAHLAGVLQLILAVGALIEVMWRFTFGSSPEPLTMIGVAAAALIANSLCLFLIHKHREGGPHMKASWIFSANDVVINLGVIIAGALVAWTGSSYPDLIVGTIVGLIVLNGARRILALRA